MASLAPDEGETVADVFYRDRATSRRRLKLAPDGNGLIYLPETAFATAFAQHATMDELVVLQGCSTLSIEFPVEERIGSGESGSISILTEC